MTGSGRVGLRRAPQHRLRRFLRGARVRDFQLKARTRCWSGTLDDTPGGASLALGCVSGSTPGNNLEGFTDFHLKAKAKIWP